ncbi:hypothetical protein AC249_AIPGENE28758 [Exaiptasia diaphana]|nr:hypothetical protein AC249_AIPGENE28758 [Exaiptasia diaphana]
MGEAWLQNHLQTFSEPMPQESISHIHVPTKKSVFEEKPENIQISQSSKYNDRTPKLKSQPRWTKCQFLWKRYLEAGKSSTAMVALKDERQKHKDLYI